MKWRLIVYILHPVQILEGISWHKRNSSFYSESSSIVFLFLGFIVSNDSSANVSSVSFLRILQEEMASCVCYHCKLILLCRLHLNVCVWTREIVVIIILVGTDFVDDVVIDVVKYQCGKHSKTAAYSLKHVLPKCQWNFSER